jgi:ribosomal protein S18 acetylase RimI-like enzyme
MALVVRELRPSDFSDVVDNYYGFYDEIRENPSFGIVLYRKKPSLSDELSWFSGLYKLMAEGDAVVIVAEMDSRVVGLCEVTRGLPDSDVSHRGFLGISVSKGQRRKGVGRALMRGTLRRCNGRFEVIELGVLTTNTPAKKLYAKFGFKRFGLRPHSFKRGDRYFDEELMRSELRGLA